MTDPQWVAPGSGAPADPAPAAGGYPAYAPGGPSATPPPAPQFQPAPLLDPRQGMDFRPGIIPLRPLALGDIFGAVIRAIRGNVGATMGLAVLTTLAFLVPTTALGAWVAGQETAGPDTASSLDASFPVAGTLGSYLPTLGTSLSTILLTGFVAFVIGQAVMGRRVTAGQTWDGTRGRLLAVLGATIVTGLIIAGALALVLVIPVLMLVGVAQSSTQNGLGGAVLLVVLAALLAIALVVFLSTRLAFVTAVVVLERTGVGGGLTRSWRLTGGTQFWRVLGIRILTGILVAIAAQIVSIPLSIVSVVGVLGLGDPQHFYLWQAVIAGVSGLITGALTTPFTAGVDSLLYVDQRIRREGFDVQLIAAAQADARQWSPGAAARS
jgi:hypothetical protein